MDRDFDGWAGIFGQYARGWSEHARRRDLADGCRHAKTIRSRPTGSGNIPTDDGKGGLVFMHNGDNLVRYPDHGAHKECRLFRDICRGLIGATGAASNS